MSSTDFDEHPEKRGSIKLPGRYCATCVVPPNYLRAGRYWVDLSSSIPGQQILDTVTTAISFEVVDTGSVESKLGQGRRGIIAPVLPWSTVTLAEGLQPCS